MCAAAGRLACLPERAAGGIMKTACLAVAFVLAFVGPAVARGGSSFGGFKSYREPAPRCVGVCFGVPSTVNGMPRNNYVNPYIKQDGTFVQPYTRSAPAMPY